MANVIGRAGGTRSWRNANPGNLVDGDYARSAGAVGRDDKGFAIFPDDQTGWSALLGLLRTAKYQALSVRDAIFTWAPPDSNNSAAYAKFVAGQLGVAQTTPVAKLTTSQLTTMGSAIRQYEGWTVGTTSSSSSSPTTTTPPASSPSSSYAPAGTSKTGIELVRVGVAGQVWTVAKQYADRFQGFLNDAFAEGLVKDNPDTAKVETFYSSGGYNYRPIAGSSRLSNHAYGAAIDISGTGENYRENNSIDASVARRLAAKWGLRWGGDYKKSKDFMHFEVAGANGENVSSATPAPSSSVSGTYGQVDPNPGGVKTDGSVLGTIWGSIQAPGAAAKVGAGEAKDAAVGVLDGITRTVYAALIAAAGLALVGVGVYRTSTT
jgi:hypothetical protein